MIDWPTLYAKSFQEFLLLLKAPALVPEMLWIVTPLAITFLVMTTYFGIYRKELLGWNTAVGNTIALMFVVVDLLRRMYHMTDPASMANLLSHPITFIVVLFVLFEAALLAFSAFTHALPRSLMFFIAAPLPVNLQAYVITCFVYLRVQPTWYTLLAALALFVLFLILGHLVRLISYHLVLIAHKKRLDEAKEMRKRAKALRAKAKHEKGKTKKDMIQEAKDLTEEAEAIEKEIDAAEQAEFGESRVEKE